MEDIRASLISSLAAVITSAVSALATIYAAKINQAATAVGTKGGASEGSTTTRAPRKAIALWFAAGTAPFILAVVVFLIVRNATAGEALQVTVAQPAPDQTVGLSAVAAGRAQHLPAGQALWLYVQTEGETIFYPAADPAQVRSDGSWEQKVCVGVPEENGRAFRIYVVLLPEHAQWALRQYARQAAVQNQGYGFTELPPGHKVMQVRRVNLNVSNPAARC